MKTTDRAEDDVRARATPIPGLPSLRNGVPAVGDF